VGPVTGGLLSGIAWVNGREIVYSAGAINRSLYRLSIAGNRVPERLNLGWDSQLVPAVSIARHRLIYASRVYRGDLVRLDTQAGTLEPLVSARGLQLHPRYSPDGRKIAFFSTRSGNPEIWTCNADGSGCEQLTSFGGPFVTSPRWSPDGRRIAFDARPEDKSQIYFIAADGGEPQRLTSGNAWNSRPDWSQDGQWIYFTSDRSGRDEIWKMPAAGGEPVQVTRTGGASPMVSSEGDALYYQKQEEGYQAQLRVSLYRMPEKGGPAEEILPLRGDRYWDVNRMGLYFLTAGNELRVRDLRSGKTRTLAQVPQAGLFSVSPDGAWVAMEQSQPTLYDLMLVEDFK